MSNQNNDKKPASNEGRLLSEQERIAFRMISSGNDLHGQRAVALLAIDRGATQLEAAQQAGLSPGQVKYWLEKFRRVRMEIFPDQVLSNETSETKQERLEPGDLLEKKPKKTKATKKDSGKKSKSKKGMKSEKAKAKGNKKKKGKGKKKKTKK